MEKHTEYYLKAKKMGKKTISYSQFNMYSQCPKHWELQYIKKLGKWDPTIFNVFGTAIHEVIQEFLEVMYGETAKKAEALPLAQMLKQTMFDLYKKEVEKAKGEHFSTADDLQDIYYQGVDILDYLVKNRGKYFSKKNTELLGIEMPIFMETETNPNIIVFGFMDVVLKEGDKIRILDLKTSTWGWSKAEKKKNGDQLRLYKRYFSKQYDVPESDINVEYLIVKRKLYENMDFPMKRFQVYEPANGKPSLNKMSKKLDNFVDSVFNMDGTYKTDAEYPAITGEKNCNCRWCPFVKDYDTCPKEARKVQ